ncbi:MAG TPA: PepSY domain-containing protein [Planctomycetota bacterium]|nr:PepSY domain-containing protein [Planctomycetota bacterium]
MLKSAVVLVGMALACLTTPTPTKPERLLKESKISLPEAVEKAIPELKEGSPVSAKLREEKDRILYLVDIAQGETATRMSIDARTQEIVSKTPLKKNYSKLIGASKLSLNKLVGIATAKVAGKASRISLGLKKGNPVAEVIVFKDGKLFEVKINAVTGSVIKVEEDDDDDDDGDEDDGDDGDDDEDDDD